MTKLVIFLAILSNVFFPWGIATGAEPLAVVVGALLFLAKIMLLALVIAMIESSISKMRLFRLPNLLTGAFMLALLAVISYYILGVA